MLARFHALLAFSLFLSAGAVSCREPKTPVESIADLRSPEAQERRSAADDLRTDQGVPPEAIVPLLQAIQVEQVPNVRGAILITLGKSGVPEAKPFIDQAIATTDRDMRRWAGRALKNWLIATRQVPAEHSWPEDFPYGQPGYPPPLPPENE
jgi:hypothetical protein